METCIFLKCGRFDIDIFMDIQISHSSLNRMNENQTTMTSNDEGVEHV